MYHFREEFLHAASPVAGVWQFICLFVTVNLGESRTLFGRVGCQILLLNFRPQILRFLLSDWGTGMRALVFHQCGPG